MWKEPRKELEIKEKIISEIKAKPEGTQELINTMDRPLKETEHGKQKNVLN